MRVSSYKSERARSCSWDSTLSADDSTLSAECIFGGDADLSTIKVHKEFILVCGAYSAPIAQNLRLHTTNALGGGLWPTLGQVSPIIAG